MEAFDPGQQSLRRVSLFPDTRSVFIGLGEGRIAVNRAQNPVQADAVVVLFVLVTIVSTKVSVWQPFTLV